MDTKLTLKLDDSIINRAKKYASTRKLSLSKLIESYLNAITLNDDSDFEISPFVKSISNRKSIPIDLDYKKQYTNYLDQKYK